MIGGLNVVAGQEFDHFKALVHRLLDQRVATQCTNYIQSGNIRFVAVTEFRQRCCILSQKLDATGLHKCTRWNGTQARDDAIALHASLAGFSVENDGLTGFD